MSSTTVAGKVRPTTGFLSWSALLVGVFAVAQFVLSYPLLAWVWPGAPLAIAILTTLAYAVPVVGVVVGHLARRREGATAMSSIGLVLSYLTLAGVVVPLLIGLVTLLITS
ncbi:hypothetical protein [Herbiconiux liangxiaofengii]|uniref:hypothetical protein n=1 Tax=Herbiconiux liangxiaofengii TaxID=3342795 RepID=UPI0035B73B68